MDLMECNIIMSDIFGTLWIEERTDNSGIPKKALKTRTGRMEFSI